MFNQITSLGISKTEALELINISKNVNKDLKLLKKGYPIQYLIGYVNFCGNKIIVNKNVLIPRYTTEYLVEKSIKYFKKLNINKPVILDLCTGSGCIAITLKKEFKDSIIYASDISKKALKLAKKNAKKNEVNIIFIKSNLFKNLKNKKFDLIISNPPYVSTSEKLQKQLNFEPKIALFSKNNGFYHTDEILLKSNKYLKKKSILALETNMNFNNKKYLIEKDLEEKNRYLFLINE